MKKVLFLVAILSLSVFSTACINNLAVQELNNKALDYMKKGDYENAISRLKSSADLDSSIFETQYNLAVAYTENDDYEEAVEAFKKAEELNEKSADVFYSRAVMYENYAKDFFKGETKKQQEALKEEALNDENENVSKNDFEEFVPSEEDKNKTVELYNNSISDYEKYLEFSENANDNAEVQSKIEQIKAVIQSIETGVDTN